MVAATFYEAPRVFKVFSILLILLGLRLFFHVHGCHKNTAIHSCGDKYTEPYTINAIFRRKSRILRFKKLRTVYTWCKYGYLRSHLAKGNGIDHVIDLTIFMDIHSNPGPGKNTFQCEIRREISKRSSPLNASTTGLIKYSRTALLQLRKNNSHYLSCDVITQLKEKLIFKSRGRRAGRNSFIPIRITERTPGKSIHFDDFAQLHIHSTSLHINTRNLTNIKIQPSKEVKLLNLMNCCLLNARSVRNKTLIVKDFVVDNSVDILALTETWLNASGDDLAIGELRPSGYKFIHTPREGSNGGGVGLLFRDTLKIIDRTVGVKFKSFEFLDVSCVDTKNVRIIVVYRPPPSHNNSLSTSLFFEEFTCFLEQIIGSPDNLLLAGDFNFHVDDMDNSEAKQFITLLDTFNLKQFVNEPTHKHGHTLDLVITRSDENIIKDVYVSHMVISDHFPTCFKMYVEKPQPRKKVLSSRNLKGINMEAFKNDILDSNLFDENTDLEAIICQYENILSSTLDLHAPIKQRTIVIRPKAPWHTDEIVEQKKLRRRLERKWRSTRSFTDRTTYTDQCSVINKLIYSSKQKYYMDLIKEHSKDRKMLFRTIGKLLQSNTETLYPTRSDDLTLANDFADFFSEKIVKIKSDIARKRCDFIDRFPDTGVCSSIFHTFKPVTCEDVMHLIKKSPLKSCIIDPIPAPVLKDCLDILLPTITKIINLSLDSGSVPDKFKVAMLTPIIKKPKANHEEFSNFRPVSNLPFISKLIEKAVATQLNNYITVNNLHESNQSAYKIHHSTETALLKIQNDILMSIDQNQSVILIFLDMSAAFDTVNHVTLLTRLSTRFGIHGTALKWFESYLSNRKQFVNINASKSSLRDLETGVPQGSVLGPILYLLYTSPMSDIIKEHNLRYHFFADDSQLFIAFKSKCHDELLESKNRIEECISEINSWMSLNDLKLNHEKTEFLLLHSKFQPCPSLPSIKIGEKQISQTSSATNLGVIFDKHLSSEGQIKKVCQSSFLHLRNFKKIRKFLTVEATQILVHAFIISRIDYCNSLIYGVPKYLINRLQCVQNSAARLVSSSKKFDHITPVLIDLHWLPVQYRIIFKILLMVYKALNKMAPSYLSDLLNNRTSKHSLRSISKELLTEPCSRLKTYGDRSFSVAAPRLWNKLPYDIRKRTHVDYFKSELKTHLFKQFLRDKQL